MADWDYGQLWYHGSPFELTTLRAGSTITQIRHLAEVFSHKPEFVMVSDDGSIQHNGALPGFLYIIDEQVNATDAYPHPRTTMADRWEWLTRRELHLRLVGPVTLQPNELMTAEVIAALRKRVAAEPAARQ